MLSELVLCGLEVFLLISVLPLCLGDSVVKNGPWPTTESPRHRGSTEKNQVDFKWSFQQDL